MIQPLRVGVVMRRSTIGWLVGASWVSWVPVFAKTTEQQAAAAMRALRKKHSIVAASEGAPAVIAPTGSFPIHSAAVWLSLTHVS